mmetsp:Transcript_1826/g.4014  ORF Transcript_1826/g.4014 Transcript_1826/m.4014 type:complete len:131 (+) Transcript_1826:2267-2659(+)
MCIFSRGGAPRASRSPATAMGSVPESIAPKVIQRLNDQSYGKIYLATSAVRLVPPKTKGKANKISCQNAWENRWTLIVNESKKINPGKKISSKTSPFILNQSNADSPIILLGFEVVLYPKVNPRMKTMAT